MGAFVGGLEIFEVGADQAAIAGNCRHLQDAGQGQGRSKNRKEIDLGAIGDIIDDAITNGIAAVIGRGCGCAQARDTGKRKEKRKDEGLHRTNVIEI